MRTDTTEYHKAFEAYMRRGTPIGLSLKKARTTTHYIWRTSGDNRVRASHAANNGKIFSWDSPPPTGHPGDDFGCRCVAEPYAPDVAEYFNITLQNVSDTGPAWSNFDCSWHYFFGQGKKLILHETGNLEKIVAEYRRTVIDDPKRLPGQIAKKARENIGRSFRGGFDRSYQMKHVVYSLGNTTISGVFDSRCEEDGVALLLSGSIEFELYDEFRDPLNIGYLLKKLGIDPRIDEAVYEAIANGNTDIGL